MLGGEVSFRLTGIAANAEKFFHEKAPFGEMMECHAAERNRLETTFCNVPIIAHNPFERTEKAKN